MDLDRNRLKLTETVHNQTLLISMQLLQVVSNTHYPRGFFSFLYELLFLLQCCLVKLLNRLLLSLLLMLFLSLLSSVCTGTGEWTHTSWFTLVSPVIYFIIHLVYKWSTYSTQYIIRNIFFMRKFSLCLMISFRFCSQLFQFNWITEFFTIFALSEIFNVSEISLLSHQ